MINVSIDTDDNLTIPVKSEVVVKDALILKLANGNVIKVDATYDLSSIDFEYHSMIISFIQSLGKNSLVLPR